jgi:hypothetical protein
MRPVRDLFSDLVERRLWPVALVLVAALVAVPLLLAKSPAEEPAAPAVPPAAVASAAADPAETSVVTAVEPTDAAPLRGARKDPFRQQHVPKPEETGDAPAASGAGTDPAGGGSGGAGTGGSGDADDGDSGQKTFQIAMIDVRFGKAIGHKTLIRDVPRLTPLPKPANPIVVFLGMRKDLETAVFLISTDVHAQGDGTCVPSRKLCEAIELKKGDVAFLDVAAADGTTDQYELELVDVRIEQTTSQADADAAYARVSRAGARILRRREARSSNALGRPFRVPFRYAQRRGYLHVAPHLARGARARHAAAGRAGRVEAFTGVQP